jgi:MoxR-like ATPase
MSDIAEAARLAAREQCQRLGANIRRTIKGKDEAIEQVLVCLLAQGHLLLEDLPGVGKTTLAYSLARSLDCSFSRIQFTSDLLPSDVTGVSIYDERVREFVFKRGPVFAHIVLADEINRATPKTQSALLEVMDRGKISNDGATHDIGAPFMVFATQNPVDYEGTFPLPESQLDRFLMRLRLGYPAAADEMEILRRPRLTYDTIAVDPVITRAEVVAMQEMVGRVYIEESVLGYLLAIVGATRTESEFRTGVSVRGGLALKQAAQARALLRGRDFVVPEDISHLVVPVLAHRLSLARQGADAIEERSAIESILRRLLGHLSEPV